MKIALMSHRGGNIGHDFMAIGMEEVTRRAFGKDVVIEHFEQHKPFEVYPAWHPLRLVDAGSFAKNRHIRHRTWKIRDYLSDDKFCRMFWPQTKKLDYALSVACGGPTIRAGLATSPTIRLMFHHMLGAFHYRGTPVIDGAVGSCYPIELPQPTRVEDPMDRAYYQTEFQYCAALTVRDKLAFTLWEEMGAKPRLIPCAALVAGYSFERMAEEPDEKDKVILFNFQERGANEDWGQGVDTAWWRKTVQEAIVRLGKRHKVEMLCHNKKEAMLAEGFGVPVNFPKNYEEYARAIRRAKTGCVSRVHAALPLASVGVPSFLIGTDSRLQTLQQIGQPTAYVKTVTAERIEEELERLLDIAKSEKERLADLRLKTADEYADLFRAVAKSS